MSEIIRKKVCRCENCGNEAEMLVTCSLPDDAKGPTPKNKDNMSAASAKVKGMAVCSHCGNEADMWIDL